MTIPSSCQSEQRVPRRAVVFHVSSHLNGSCRLEREGGDFGGVFVSKAAALNYLRLELAEDETPLIDEQSDAAQAPGGRS